MAKFNLLAGRAFALALTLATLTLATLTLATPARAQDTEDGPPDNPALVDVPPDNPELPEDKPVFIDPRVGFLLVGFDGDVVMGGSFGVDIHWRLAQHHSLVLDGSIGGGGDVSNLDGERGRYAYAFGVHYSFRAFLDVFRALAGFEFVELRDQGNLVVGHGTTASLVLEGGGNHVLGRLALKAGPGWDAEGDIGTIYSAELSVLYSF